MTLYIFCLISSRVVVVIWINQRHKKLSFWLQVFFSSLYGLEMVLCLVMYVTFMFLIERYKKHQMIWTTNECSFVLWYLWFINVKLHASLHINDLSNTFNHRNFCFMHYHYSSLLLPDNSNKSTRYNIWWLWICASKIKLLFPPKFHQCQT